MEMEIEINPAIKENPPYMIDQLKYSNRNSKRRIVIFILYQMWWIFSVLFFSRIERCVFF